MEIKISSLRVTECGPLKDVRIDFNDSEKDIPQPITVLGGANGTGKTTTLELIFSLLYLFKFSPKARFAPIEDLSLDILKQAEYAELKLFIDNEPCIVFWGEDKTENDYNQVKIRNKHGIQCIVDEEFNEKWEIPSTGTFPEKINAFIKKLALVQLNGNRIKIKWLSKYAKRLITVCFQTVYRLIFLKNPIELNQCQQTGLLKNPIPELLTSASYRIRASKTIRKQLGQLSGNVRNLVRQRMLSLSRQPRPDDARELQRHPGYYRIWISGRFRQQISGFLSFINPSLNLY